MREPAPPLRLAPEQCLVAMMGLQDKRLQAVAETSRLIRRCVRLVQAGVALGLPAVACQQRPAALGQAVPELARTIDDLVEHDRVSGFDDQLAGRMTEHHCDTLVIAGIETHTDVLLTSLDAMEAGHRVVHVCDASASRRSSDHRAARRRLQLAGVLPTSVESLIIELSDRAPSAARRTAMDALAQ